MGDKPQRLKDFSSNSGRDYELFLNEEANHEFKIFFKCLILSFSSTSYFPKPFAESDIIYPTMKEDRLIKSSLKSFY